MSAVIGPETESGEATVRIRDFRALRELKVFGRHIATPLFQLGGAKFALHVYPAGGFLQKEHETGWVSVAFDQTSNKQRRIAAKASFAVVGANGDVVLERTLDKLFVMSKGSAGIPEFCKFEKICTFLVDGSLNFRVSATAHYEAEGDVSEPIVRWGMHASHSFADDLGAALASGAGGDVEIIIGPDASRRVNSFLLAARSPVFAAMFASNMTEANSRRIEIKDADVAAVDAFLQFVYTDKLPPAADVALSCRVLVLAKKYEVLGLIEACAGQVMANISVSTAAEVLNIASLHDMAALKQDAIAFITRDPATIRAVQDSEAFDSLSKSAVIEILSAASGKRRRTGSVHEFPDGSDWASLSAPQLRRACTERGLPSDGKKATMMARLSPPV